MPAKGRSSESYKAYYGSYNYDAQRRKRLNRHLKKQPNDEQAKEALKNIHHRGPRPSNKNEGVWMTRDMMLSGLDEKKKLKYIDMKPKVLAWIRGIMRRAAAQEYHENNYASKEQRKKGGKSSKLIVPDLKM
jgi:hypothetical protein